MYDQLAKKGNRVHARRRIFEDGRVTDQVEFWIQTQEQNVWASGGDWRAAIEIAVQGEPGGSFDNGIVRLYARTGNTRSLIKQGRYGPPVVNRTKLVLSTRSVPCDELIVAVQGVSSASPPLTEQNKVRLSVGMHGFEPSPPIQDITQQLGGGPFALATPFQISPANFPAFFYSLTASLSTAAATTRFIWVSSDPAMGNAMIPIIPIAPGGVASIDLSNTPVGNALNIVDPQDLGLFIGLSSTFATYTGTVDAWSWQVNYT